MISYSCGGMLWRLYLFNLFAFYVGGLLCCVSCCGGEGKWEVVISIPDVQKRETL